MLPDSTLARYRWWSRADPRWRVHCGWREELLRPDRSPAAAAWCFLGLVVLTAVGLVGVHTAAVTGLMGEHGRIVAADCATVGGGKGGTKVECTGRFVTGQQTLVDESAVVRYKQDAHQVDDASAVTSVPVQRTPWETYVRQDDSWQAWLGKGLLTFLLVVGAGACLTRAVTVLRGS